MTSGLAVSATQRWDETTRAAAEENVINTFVQDASRTIDTFAGLTQQDHKDDRRSVHDRLP